MKLFNLEIVTPIKILDKGQVEYVRCPGLDGNFGVMANHREAIIAIGVGEIKIVEGGKNYFLATSGGFAEITKKKVELLLETYEQAKEIDAPRAKEALKRAEERKNSKKTDSARNNASFHRAKNRLIVSKKK